jgi:hypothetical protein
MRIHFRDMSEPAPISRMWPQRILMLAATSIIVGVLWDISWHRTIGRDSFWTPAHMAIYLGGVLGGCTGGWLALQATFFRREEMKDAAVRVWGLRAPFGAWVAIWGAIAMLTSAPFDDWWHSAYGIDAKILSPPHTVLALGMWAIVWAAVFMMLKAQNLAQPASANPAATSSDRWFVVYAGGILIAMAATFLTELSWPNDQHRAPYYFVSAACYPPYLVALGHPARVRFASTRIALFYMGIYIGMNWILQLFPGQPGLGPVRNQVTHFVPMAFPHLLVLPAIAIDLIRLAFENRRRWWHGWIQSVLMGVAFCAVFIPVQWYFSEFLLSDRAQNGFFGSDRMWGYNEATGDSQRNFWGEQTLDWSNRALQISVLKIFATAIVTSRVALWLGIWMARLRR